MISGDLLGGRGKLEEEGGATSQMYLFIWMRNGGRRGKRGGVFFLVLLFVTPLKMYMGITSKLVNRKHPLAIF